MKSKLLNAYFAQNCHMTRYDHLLRLLVLACLVIIGLVATAVVSLLLMVMNGMDLQALMEMGRYGMESFTAGQTRILLLMQHVLVFILPGFLFALIYYRPAVVSRLRLNVFPGWQKAVLGIIFLMVAYPLVNLGFKVNELMPIPEWATALEGEAAETLELILDMPHAGYFLINLLIIAILPGIGEELIFRGILQKELGSLLRNRIVAIWMAAFVFSAIHFQFEGFLPRFILGLVLGYLLYWTNNLWVPIIAHAFNNGLQVALIYFLDYDMEELDTTGSDQLSWWMVVLSVGALYFIHLFIRKNNPSLEQG